MEEQQKLPEIETIEGQETSWMETESEQPEETKVPEADGTEKVLKKEKEINFPQHTCQSLAYKCGYYVSSYMGNDLYFLNECVKIMIGYIRSTRGEEWLETHIPSWKQKKENLMYLNSRLQEVKAWYDSLENKKFDKKDADTNIRKFFFKSASKIPLLDQDLYDVFGILVANSNLKRQMIPSTALKVLEHTGYRTLREDQKGSSTGQQQQSQEQTESSG